MMNLSAHFTLEELTRSDTAVRLGLDNTPSPDVLENLRGTALRMEHVRRILDHSVIVTSGYRAPSVNAAIGSRDTSAHVLGHAVDFRCPGVGTPLQVALELERHVAELAYDQLIWEFASWVHISFNPRARHQVLSIDRAGVRLGLG